MSRPKFPGRSRTCCAPAALTIAAAMLLPAPALLSPAALAQTQTQAHSETLPPVEVEQKKPKPARAVKKPAQNAPAPAEAGAPAQQASGPAALSPGATVLKAEDLAARSDTGDTATMLDAAPGVSLYGNGGVASAPALHGLGDEHVLKTVDGMQLSPGCVNHMNPALTYISPAAVAQAAVLPGVSPVSAGGDNIGGVIALKTADPLFAAPGQGVVQHGQLSAFYRSNNNAIGTSLSSVMATENISLGYTAQWVWAENYHAADGKKMPLTNYQILNQAAQLAIRDGSDVTVLKAGGQFIPYQGFLNEAMDMTLNRSWFVNLHQDLKYSWGALETTAYYQSLRHEMNDLNDRHLAQNGYMYMPMNVDGQDFGYNVTATIPVSARDRIRVGNDFHGQTLNDYWPAASVPQQPNNDLLYINNGWRDRIGTFAEWEKKWTPQWLTQIGVRNDMVFMDTGPVQDHYRKTNPSPIPAMFNALDRYREDANFDVTALARYQPDRTADYEFGFARKMRSPDLYERYGWYMSSMAGWAGDGNNYQGNPWLKPETAYNLSFSAGWHDPQQQDWAVKITPFYTYVNDFIDVKNTGLQLDNINSLGDNNGKFAGGLSTRLQYANVDAEIYGFDLSGKKLLLDRDGIGAITAKAVVGYQHGKNIDTGTYLYRMMPLNAKAAIEQKLGNWINLLEVQAVDDKTEVDTIRKDPKTPGYAVVNIKTTYDYENLSFSFGVSNLFDHRYYLPLGGIDYINLKSVPASRTPILAEGRSFNFGMSIKF
jgi:iron complex outermembrane receptor protein